VHENARSQGFVRHALILILAALAARLAFLAFLPAGAYSSDVASWVDVDRILSNGGNPYNVTDRLNWPPFWIQIIFAIGHVARASGLEFVNVLRSVLILMEMSVLLLTYGVIRRLASPSRALILVLVSVALNPVAILLICQHGNFDIFVAAFVLLAVICANVFAESGDPVDWLSACAFIGLGVLAKTVPLVLIPMLAFGLGRLRWTTRSLGAVLVLGPASLGMSIIYILGPTPVSANVLHYRSYAGWFGVTGLLELGGLGGVIRLYTRAFEAAFLVVLAALMVLAIRRARATAEELVLIPVCLLAALPGLGPGYSPQYVYWFLPLLPIAFAVTPGAWVRRAIPVFLVIAAGTYLIEYAMFTAHGNFWAKLRPTPAVLEASARWSTKARQTLIRLPLFVAWMGLLAAVSTRVAQCMLSPAARRV
jgi:dolichyl-phosphate-mannose-protein mannosyltransferase